MGGRSVRPKGSAQDIYVRCINLAHESGDGRDKLREGILIQLCLEEQARGYRENLLQDVL